MPATSAKPARSPSVERICAAATLHFAERGYDAASLSDIAATVGIRKASLYTHFDSKDALFLMVYTDAVHAEEAFALDCFADEATDVLPGFLYCDRLFTRYADSAALRCMLRSAYILPASVREPVMTGYEAYLDKLLAAYRMRLSRLQAGALSEDDAATFGQAYLACVDSLYCELVYAAGANFPVRLAALRRVLADSLGLAFAHRKPRMTHR